MSKGNNETPKAEEAVAPKAEEAVAPKAEEAVAPKVEEAVASEESKFKKFLTDIKAEEKFSELDPLNRIRELSNRVSDHLGSDKLTAEDSEILQNELKSMFKDATKDMKSPKGVKNTLEELQKEIIALGKEHGFPSEFLEAIAEHKNSAIEEVEKEAGKLGKFTDFVLKNNEGNISGSKVALGLGILAAGAYFLSGDDEKTHVERLAANDENYALANQGRA